MIRLIRVFVPKFYVHLSCFINVVYASFIKYIRRYKIYLYTSNNNYICMQCFEGNNWRIVSGKKEGQTQVSCSQFDNICRWSFPIDIHLATAGIQGWPKIYIEVYHLDWLGRAHLFGYGLITVPTSPGSHTLDCYTWRPFGSLRERFIQYFLGGGIQLKYPDLIFSSGERYKLSTEAMGVVSFDLSVVLRNFTNYGVEYQ